MGNREYRAEHDVLNHGCVEMETMHTYILVRLFFYPLVTPLTYVWSKGTNPLPSTRLAFCSRVLDHDQHSRTARVP